MQLGEALTRGGGVAAAQEGVSGIDATAVQRWQCCIDIHSIAQRRRGLHIGT